jgi:PIN domain nuclease of toxin-antitoxin system
VKLLIDTHIYLWALAEPDKLHSNIRAALETPTNRVFVSSIVVTELMIKASLGKLEINFDPLEMAEKTGFELLSFTAEDAILLKDMPFHHKDPFDRMLIAQSLANKMQLVTEDKQFDLYDCQRLSVD